MRKTSVKISTIVLFILSLILCAAVVPFAHDAFADEGEGASSVASVEGVEYDTLLHAINEAQDNQTVVITASHTVEVSSSEDLFLIPGKTITVDLNGKTVTFTVNGSFTALFKTESGGHLTLKDSSLDEVGTFNVIVESGSLANMVRNEDGCSITIESGNYRQNKSTNGSGMIDTRCDTSRTDKVGVYVSGGNFHLGNIGGEKNGSPWIFNGSGQNTVSVYVSGGTFNADVFHQYYPFEVDIVNTIALHNNGDGTYTVVPAVCSVNESHWSSAWYTNEVGYETFEEGFAVINPDAYQIDENTYAASTLTVLDDCATLQDGFSVPTDKNVIVKFNRDFTIEEGFTLSEGVTLNVEGDLYVNADFELPSNDVLSVRGNVYVAEDAQMTVASGAIVNLLPPDGEVVAFNADEASVFSVHGTLVNNGEVNLFESGASVDVYGVVENNGVMGTKEEFEGTVAIREVTKINKTGDSVTYRTGNYGQAATAATPFVESLEDVYTLDGSNYYPLTAEPVILLSNAEGKLEMYATIHEAYEKAEAGDEITLLESISCEGLVINKDITINFNNKTYTVTRCVGSAGTQTIGLQIYKDNNVVLKNGTLAAGVVTEGKSVKMLIQNYANLTVEDMILDGTGSAEMQYVLSNNSGNVSITGNTDVTAPSGAVAFDVYDYSSAGYSAPVVNVNTTGVITGEVELSQTIEDNLVIVNGTFSADVDIYCAVGYHAVKNGDVYVVERHTMQKTVATEPNCTDTGNSDYWTCTTCDKYFSDEASENEIEENSWIIPQLGHEEEEHAKQDATCTEIGWNAYVTCNRCTYSTYEEIPQLGHEEEEHAKQDATCTEIGWNAYVTCNRCTYSTYAEIPQLGHEEEQHAKQDATCTEIGWNAYVTCERCTYSTYEEIPQLGHEEEEHAKQDATCTEIGWNAYVTCNRCTYSTYEEIPQLGHEEEEHAKQDATCTEIGWNAYVTCERCTYSTYEEIPQLGHEEEEHAKQDATCTEIGWNAYVTCNRCTYSTYAEIPQLGHEEEQHAKQDATCTEIGWNAYVTCERCTYSTYAEIPQLGHTYTNRCDVDCDTCHATREVAAHASEDGDGICDDCNEKFTVSDLEVKVVIFSSVATLSVLVLVMIKMKKKPTPPTSKSG